MKVLFARFDDTDAKEYTSKEFETLRPEYEHAYAYLDYMNNAPDTSANYQPNRQSNKISSTY